MNKIGVLVMGSLCFVLSAFFSYSFFSTEASEVFRSPIVYKAPTQNGNNPVINESEPKTEECPLNGELLSKTQRDLWEKRRPLGIMIENHKESRPQSGITSADIVYEGIAEGGITRTLDIYYCKDAPYVGPVRSARVPFIDQLAEYGEYPLYVHVGGANCDRTTGSGCANGAKADALGKIQKLDWDLYNDMNQFSVPFPVFYRDPDRLPGRATEHTVYSSTKKLWDYAKTKRELTNVDEKGTSWDEDFQKWKFKDDEKTKGTVTKISMYFTESMPDFTVDWNYDPLTNSYKRVNGAEPHMDKNNNKQISPKNVVILFEDFGPANDGYDGGHIVYGTTGTGDALVFQDGNAIKATWKKKDIFSRLMLYDEKNKEIAFTRGQIFIQLVPEGNKVTY